MAEQALVDGAVGSCFCFIGAGDLAGPIFRSRSVRLHFILNARSCRQT